MMSKLMIVLLVNLFINSSFASTNNYANLDQKKILIATYNVANEPATNVDMKTLLKLPNDPKDLPDIVAVGFQEVKFSPTSSFTTSDYEKKLFDVLSVRHYRLIDSVRLVGLLLVAYVRIETSSPSTTGYANSVIGNVEKSWVRTGFGGLFGNKGAVGLSIILNGKRLALVNSHLPPHEGKIDDRISAFNAINHGLTFNKHGHINDHDYTIWFGDLNFRVEQFSGQEINDAIERNDVKRIFERDELTMVRNDGRAFRGYKEAEVNFYPTYKFYSGGNSYNLKRKPAWTDRILYRVKPNEVVPLEAAQYNYLGRFGMTASDHRPVVCDITIKV